MVGWGTGFLLKVIVSLTDNARVLLYDEVNCIQRSIRKHTFLTILTKMQAFSRHVQFVLPSVSG